MDVRLGLTLNPRGEHRCQHCRAPVAWVTGVSLLSVGVDLGIDWADVCRNPDDFERLVKLPSNCRCRTPNLPEARSPKRRRHDAPSR